MRILGIHRASPVVVAKDLTDRSVVATTVDIFVVSTHNMKFIQRRAAVIVRCEDRDQVEYYTEDVDPDLDESPIYVMHPYSFLVDDVVDILVGH